MTYMYTLHTCQSLLTSSNFMCYLFCSCNNSCGFLSYI